MRLLVDLQGCQNGSRHRGIGRYSLSLVKALARNAGEHQVYVLLSGLFADTVGPLQRELRSLIDPTRILVFNAPGPVDELRTENTWRQRSAELLREQMIADFAPDALLVSSMVDGSMDNTVTSVGWLPSSAVVGTMLYDLIPLLDPERYIGWAPLKQWYFNKMDSVRRADLLLAISASAAQEAISALGIDAIRVANISTAADELFEGRTVAPTVLAACQRKFGIQRPYLMHSGNIEARKNFQGLIKAYAALPGGLRQTYQLVLVGKFSTEARAELEAVAHSEGLQADDLVLTGHVTDDDLVALYAGCHLFVFPSLHEGFGLPALEAMHFGVPTIGSNTTSVPEVIGRSDATFDPASVPAITALISRVLTDATFYASLKAHALAHARTFSWDDCARRALKAFEQALLRRRATPLATRADAAARLHQLTAALVADTKLALPSPQDMLAVANCLARNETEVIRARAQASHGGALNWRVEGPFDSTYSLALVNREAARALAALGHHVVLHSTEGPGDFDASPAFLALHPDLAGMHRRAAGQGHANVDVVSRNLYPPRVADMAGSLNLLHHYAWEESGFPAEWVEHFNRHLQGITCTSSHVMKVLQDNGVRVPMAVIGNGVDHWDRIDATPGLRFPGKGFRFLHVSSCFPRKGADVMLQAYGDVCSLADDVSLVIKTFPNPHNDIHERIAACRAANPQYPDVHVIEADLSDADLKALYQHCHVLVAPSRAEGFGLPLAEAMLSGLAVITTAWGGQSDFCTDHNAWLVDYRFTATQTHFGLQGSVWAEPDRASLADAMRRARSSAASRRLAMAEHGRALLMANYRWSDVAARAVGAVRQWQADVASQRLPPRIGWVTTWNTKCGIATYSRHLIEAADTGITVLAPRQDGRLRSDEDFCHRCWLSDKTDNDFAALAACIDAEALDVLVLQFNYGFFNLHRLAAFLHDQIDAGRTLIVTMHSTGDPPALAGDANWRLATLAPALARCQRLLVHSIADLNNMKAVGLTDNVALFPHPLRQIEAPPAAAAQPALRFSTMPLVATFGFCLPHKGLPEVVDAVDLLRRQGNPVRLRMLNAEYPDPTSSNLVAALRRQIDTLGLGDLVELRTEYLSDGDVTAQLAEASLLVFPYQDTQESTSAAVRHGMATARPVAVTPIGIFDELGASVFRFAGLQPHQLAAGIAEALASVASQSPQALATQQAAACWRAAHEVGLLARRLLDICSALAPPAPRPALTWSGSSRMFRTEVGEPVGATIRTTGRAGYLLFGPYQPLHPGRFTVTIVGTCRRAGRGEVGIDVSVGGGETVLARADFAKNEGAGTLATVPFELMAACSDLEVRVMVDDWLDCSIEEVKIGPNPI